MIDKIDDDLPFEIFVANYLVANRPCLITEKATRHWNARRNWVKSGKLDIEFLVSKYGSLKVPVVNCEQRQYDAQTRCEMTFSEFAEYWQRRAQIDASHMAESCLYLKDWHLQRATDEKFYEVSRYFSSDWLNEFLDYKQADDYKFTYIGPKGSWTPFHADVFGSYSWSTNVCGRKLWYLLAPGDEEKLKNSRGQLPYDLRLVNKDGKIWKEIFQEEGETMFVPSGWYHQVFNLEDTVSINHNWFNGANIHHIYSALLRAYESVCEELSDCKPTSNDPTVLKEWNDQCQLVLRCHHGMNIRDFGDLVCFIGERRVAQQANDFLTRFDLQKAVEVLERLTSVDQYTKAVRLEKIQHVIAKIKSCLATIL